MERKLSAPGVNLFVSLKGRISYTSLQMLVDVIQSILTRAIPIHATASARPEMCRESPGTCWPALGLGPSRNPLTNRGLCTLCLDAFQLNPH